MHCILKEANNIAVVALARYCGGDNTNIWTIEGACISRRKTGRRSGVAADAISYRYLVEHPEQGWSFAFRSVWRDGNLMSPTATHTVIESYYDDAETGDIVAVQEAVNDWLKSLPI